MTSIAEKDAAMPKCRQCSMCYGSPLNHHWMLDSEESDSSDDARMILICLHCDAKIDEFDLDDPDCPDY